MFSPAMAKVHVVALVGAFEPPAFRGLSEREQQRRVVCLTKYLRKLAHALSSSPAGYEEVVETLAAALRSSDAAATIAAVTGRSPVSEELIFSCWSDMACLGAAVCGVLADEPAVRRAIVDALISDDLGRAAFALQCACGLRSEPAFQLALGASAKTVNPALAHLACHGDGADGTVSASARLLLGSMRESSERRRASAAPVLSSRESELAGMGVRLVAWLTRSLQSVAPRSPRPDALKMERQASSATGIIII